MDELITATDLDAWSGYLPAQGHLPSLVRAAVMGTVAPDSIRFPAAEGVGAPGFDGVVEVTDGVPPFVPAGRSVWEVGTSADVSSKAGDDYRKRTKQLPRDERARTTFVFVTSRLWPEAGAWAKRKASGPDGWAGVVALDADALALWLETLPGVRARFSEVLGRQPYGVTPLARWVQDWREATDPALPLDLPLAGRLPNARRLAAALTGPACEHVVPAASGEEGVAFVAAALLAPTLASDPAETQSGVGTAPANADQPATSIEPVDGSREAKAERTLVVHDEAAWRRCVVYDQPMILVPLFRDANVSSAVRAGHHVVVARRARAGDEALPPIGRLEARCVWERQGLPFAEADDLARSARRSLTSLRRRIGHGSMRLPEWAAGAAAASLAPLLLAGSWRDDSDGDKDVIAALDGRSWRMVVRDLAPLRAGDDAPIVERDHRWEFVDVVDAWDALQQTISADDLTSFATQAELVLSEPDPVTDLSIEERRRLTFSLEGLPKRRFSDTLRHGLADTLAVLGAVVGDRTLAGGQTGQQHADLVVYRVLHDADAARWAAVGDLLPLLAEAAPTVFLDSLEQSLARDDAPVLTLFDEQPDVFGQARSHHTPLLWALEHLAFSPRLLSRVALSLARLAERDPGGRLGNRPAASLLDLLHLLWPQSAATPDTRLAILDRLRVACPAVAWTLLLDLLRGLDHGLMLRRGPLRRDWIVPDHNNIDHRELADSSNAVAGRLAEDAGTDSGRWSMLIDLIDRLPANGRRAVLATAAARWDDIPDCSAQVAKPLAARLAEHEEFPDAAWTLPPEELALLRDFLSNHPPPSEPTGTAHTLFSCLPRLEDRELHREPGLTKTRQEALRELLADGLPAVLAFAAGTELPRAVGAILATISTDHDEAVLDLLGGTDPAGSDVAAGLIGQRHNDDPAWLAGLIAARPEQTVALILQVDPDGAVLDLVATLAPDLQDDYWRQVSPWRFPDDVAERAAEQLLNHDRPYSAMLALFDARGRRAVPLALGAQVLQAPARGTEERIDALGPSAVYVIRNALDSLDAAGADLTLLANLEWFYLPLLDDQRPPRALHRLLAQEPEFFAEMVRLAYRSDTARDSEVAAENRAGIGGKEGLTDTASSARTEPDTVPEPMSTAAWRLLRDWHAPLPGAATDTDLASVADTQRWVAEAQAALAARDRAGAAPLALGEALSGPATDPDGTWPSLPVREVLEHQQDPVLEEHLVVGRFNQRGVTGRNPYAGGSQERDLVAQYRQWARAVRDRWPRSGAVLDELARMYDIDARRHDSSAARSSEM